MRKSILYGILMGVVSAVMSVAAVADVSAITEEQLFFYGQTNALFYDPEGANCNYGLLGTYDGNVTAGLSDLQAAFVDTYHEIAEQLSVSYGIPWEAVMAQGILESAAGTSNFARERNNFFGIGAFDSNPDNAHSFDSPEEGWRGYYENIRTTATYRNHGVFTGATVTDPYAYLQAIKDAGYATSPNYVASVGAIIRAVEARAREKGWKSSAELMAAYPEMRENAESNAADGGLIAMGGGISGSCIAAGNGDINATAMELSWPDGTHAPTDPKLEYRNALEQTGVNRLGDVCSMGGYSCDAFLATVMRYSGADESFPCCGALMQLNYLSSHPEMYEEIPNLGNTSNIQPGDIRASAGHVEIVVQLENGGYGIASASHCDRTADHASNYYVGMQYRIFRRRG